MPNRMVDVVFADDIRIEKSEQISVIGVYQSIVNVPQFPFIFPKLCFWFRARTPADRLFKSLTFVIDDAAGNRLVDLDVPSDSFSGQDSVVENFDWNGIEDRFVEIGVQYAISPLICNGPMLLKGSVITESETLKANSLRIQLATEGSSPILQQFAIPEKS